MVGEFGGLDDSFVSRDRSVTGKDPITENPQVVYDPE